MTATVAFGSPTLGSDSSRFARLTTLSVHLRETPALRDGAKQNLVVLWEHLMDAMLMRNYRHSFRHNAAAVDTGYVDKRSSSPEKQCDWLVVNNIPRWLRLDLWVLCR